MTIVTSKIVRGGVALFVALGIMTFGINSFQPVHAMPIVGTGGGTSGSGSGSGGSTKTAPPAAPTAPAAPYVTNMNVTVSNGREPGWGGPTSGWNGTCQQNCAPSGGSMVTVNYNIQFADATPNAIVYCYVYLVGFLALRPFDDEPFDGMGSTSR